MESFSEKLPDGRTLNGLISLPPKPSPTINAPYLPLIVCVHGGTYTADYFNACPSTSIANLSTPLHIPIIAISRPGYGGSTHLPPPPAPSTGTTFIQETGKHLHTTILPFLWQKYGPHSGATSLVLLSHSIGSAVAIVAAALHAEDTSTSTSPPTYPLSGLITSGIGTHIILPPATPADAYDRTQPPTNDSPLWPLDHKDRVMLCADQGLCPPDAVAQSAALNHAMRVAERADIQMEWLGYWRGYAEKVVVPHLYGIGEREALWDVSETCVREYAEAFPRSVRREAGVVLGAPHCMELSYAGRGWLTRCLGFGVECAVWWGVREKKGGGGEGEH